MKSIKQNKHVYIFIIALVVCAGLIFYYFWFRQPAEEQISGEKTMEDVIRDLTAPANAQKTEVSEDVIRSLTVPE